MNPLKWHPVTQAVLIIVICITGLCIICERQHKINASMEIKF